MSDVFFGPKLQRADLDNLAALHLHKQFAMVSSSGALGAAHLDESPQALVTELIRLAIIGTTVLEVGAARPNAKLSAVIAKIGGA